MTSRPTSISTRLFGALLLAGLVSPLAAVAQGNAAAGKTVYDRRCVGCHGDAKRAATQGPTLVGLMGRKAGAVGGTTSRALSESGIVWSDATLQQYLASPGDKVHGTIMPVGTQNPKERDDLIAYIKSMR
jgi:cytochrome c